MGQDEKDFEEAFRVFSERPEFKQAPLCPFCSGDLAIRENGLVVCTDCGAELGSIPPRDSE